MKRLLALFFLIHTVLFNAFSQKLEQDQLVQLNAATGKEGIIVAHIYSVDKKLCDIWELQVFVPSLKISEYNDLIEKRDLVPHGEHTHYSENLIVLYKENYKEGKLHGKYERYYPSGEKHITCSFLGNALHGDYMEYSDEGKLIFATSFINSRKKGEEKAFYTNGQEKYSTTYNDGMPDGQLKAYYENGELKRKASYQKGKIIKQKCFDSHKNNTDCKAFETSLDYPGGIKTIFAEILNITLDTSRCPGTNVFFLQLDINESGEIESTQTIPEVSPINQTELENFLSSLKSFIPPITNGEKLPSTLFLKIDTKQSQNSFLNGKIITKSSYTFNPKTSKLRYTVFNTLEDEVFFRVEKMPEFPGGEQALRMTIANTVKYPVEAQIHRISGKVYVSFVVNKMGYVTNPVIAKGVHPILDKEAIRVISKLPNWKPGTKDGEPVNVSYTVPINFVLGGSKPKKITESDNHGSYF